MRAEVVSVNRTAKGYNEIVVLYKGQEKIKRLYGEELQTKSLGLSQGQEVELKMQKNEKGFWDVVDILEVEALPAPNPQPAEKTDWDKIGRQKARCDLFQSACHLLAGIYTHAEFEINEISKLGEQAVIIAEVGEAYVFGEEYPRRQAENKVESKPITQGEMLPEYVSGQMIKNLMRYSNAVDEEDLRIKAETFLGSKLPGIGAMKNTDAQRWAKDLLKVKK